MMGTHSKCDGCGNVLDDELMDNVFNDVVGIATYCPSCMEIYWKNVFAEQEREEEERSYGTPREV